MPRGRATAAKKTTPTIVSALTELQETIESIGPQLESWIKNVTAALNACLEMAGVSTEPEEEEEETPKAGKAKVKAAKVEEPEEEDDAPDFDEMDEDDLAAFVKKNKLPVKLAKIKGLKKQRAEVEEAWEESQAEEPEAQEEPDFDEMDEDDLSTFVDDNDLDVDLDKYNTVKKQRAAVAKAYAEASGAEEEDDDNSDEKW